MSKELKYLVIHCTATPEGRAVTPDSIALWHRGALKNADGTFTFLGKKYTSAQLKNLTLILPSGKAVAADKTNGRGWSALGYTDMILLDGSLVRLTDNNEDDIVDSWEITNGVAGINNVSRHVVYVGGCDANMKPKDTRTNEQSIRLAQYVFETVRRHPKILVCGHNQFDKKACPSFDVFKWLHGICLPLRNIYIRK